MKRVEEYPFVFTAPMKKRLSPKVLEMLHEALRRFPELQGKKITVGYTAVHLGSADVPLGSDGEAKLTIRLKVRKLTFSTIGHELTHLLQGLYRIRLNRSRAKGSGKIPSGEKQCDIWTLARSSLFCDDAPTYLEMPRAIRENWPAYADRVRELCIAAIQERRLNRCYIYWLEGRLRELVYGPLDVVKLAQQMALPF